MNIIVLVKQVPDTTEMEIDKVTGTLMREKAAAITNPDDLSAIEAALQLKEKYGGKVTALTMGPPQAKNMLRELLSMGCDEGILISDMKFAGADTWATSNTLVGALVKMDYDLIIAGRQAIDGDTAQVGPQTAEKLGVPQVTYVIEIQEVVGKTITVKKMWEKSFEILQAPLPCLITVLGDMNTPRYMNVRDLWDSFDKEIKVVTAADLDLDERLIGLKGSPTNVKATFVKEVASSCEVHTLPDDEAAQMLFDLLKEKQVITH